MKTLVFEGPAGTGKTTRLMVSLAETLQTRPLAEHERVLALSKMHGSRRRLNARLSTIEGLRRRYDCATIDGFARRVLQRWRSLARTVFAADDPGTFEECCRRAGALLALPAVRKWVASTYPIVVVDEFQDSKEGQLAIVQGLAEVCSALVAGDEFQDLDAEGASPAIAWVKSVSDAVTLSTVHRTSVAGLLGAATALREGRSVATGRGFECVGVPRAPLGAWHAAKFIAGRGRGDSVAVLAPVSPGRSAFVRDLVHRVGASPLGKPPRVFGPYDLPWERGDVDEGASVATRIGIPDGDDEAVVAAGSLQLSDSGVDRMISQWLDRRRRVRGQVEFTALELREATKRIIQQHRTHRTSHRRFAAMTVHQAKNQEFDHVVILWPYEVTGSSERQRRLLYNAVTRARKRAIVIVQNNPTKKDRLKERPFTETDAVTFRGAPDPIL